MSGAIKTVLSASDGLYRSHLMPGARRTRTGAGQSMGGSDDCSAL